MNASELASTIDHSLLKSETMAPEIHKLIAEAIEHRFAAVCIAPAFVAKAAVELRGSSVALCTVISFPHGTSKPTIKAIEATSAVKDGAEELDVVAHLPNLINNNFEAARLELIELVRAARAARRETVIKVIIESAALLVLGADRGEAAIATACRAIRESGCDFVKTSTGFHPAGGASVEAVGLIKKYAQGLQIKAAGGIRDLATARAMLEAGADRLGTSNSVSIVQEAKAMI
ncbi:MAG TPA: deoxyribose-phosphate aldolase [Tepidisphaeraceae bacterium]|nr:deoxyribose-phosphate aldolase [Tepidisphaeraceae bacterium]